MTESDVTPLMRNLTQLAFERPEAWDARYTDEEIAEQVFIDLRGPGGIWEGAPDGMFAPNFVEVTLAPAVRETRKQLGLPE